MISSLEVMLTTKVNAAVIEHGERNVEDIRRRNLEDNQLFLKQLLMSNIRDDFLGGARSLVRKKREPKVALTYEKKDYPTRYKMKVKSGLIPPYVPQWQRRQEVAAKKQSPSPSMCTSIDQENLNPYERRFQPRRSKLFIYLLHFNIPLLITSGLRRKGNRPTTTMPQSHPDCSGTNSLPPERDVESIRQRNIQDNQLFLESLRVTSIRNDFVTSARSILRHKANNQPAKQQRRPMEYTTRYREKVKSGIVGPYVPEWKRRIVEKKLENERKQAAAEARQQNRLLQKERKVAEAEAHREERMLRQELRQVERQLEIEERIRLARAKRRAAGSRWSLFYKNHPHGDPYRRAFKPRSTTVGQRAEQNS